MSEFIFYNRVGLMKRLLINFYDLILLFAVLYFFTIPVIMISQGNAVLDNIFYQIYLIIIIYLYYFILEKNIIKRIF